MDTKEIIKTTMLTFVLYSFCMYSVTLGWSLCLLEAQELPQAIHALTGWFKITAILVAGSCLLLFVVHKLWWLLKAFTVVVAYIIISFVLLLVA